MTDKEGGSPRFAVDIASQGRVTAVFFAEEIDGSTSHAMREVSFTPLRPCRVGAGGSDPGDLSRLERLWDLS